MIILRKIALPPGNCTVVADTVSGTLDGSNKVFYTTYDYETDRIDLHLNGQALHSPNDFTQTGSNEITLIYDAPESDAVITATYESTACDAGGGSGGSEYFTELLDTPGSYSTHGGKIVAVKQNETGLEFIEEVPTGPQDFLELTDTPTTYSGFEGYAVKVKDDGSGLEFVPAACEILDGVESVLNGAYSVTVTFSGTTDTDYTVVTSLENTTDSPPSIYPNIITSKTLNSFTIDFAGSIDSANYKLNWRLWPSAQCLNVENVYDGVEVIPNGVNSLVVSFDFTLTSDQYALVLDLENKVDSDPSIYPVIITNKTTTGFEVAFSGDVDSSNYALNWSVSSDEAAITSCDCELVDDTSPELGGNLEIGNHLALLSTTISGAYLHGYTVGWSSTDASAMTVQRNDTGFGCPFYMNTNGQLYQCTSASGTTQMPCVALALEEGTGSNKKIMWSGIVRKDAWTWTPGDMIYVSTVAGALTSAKPAGGGEWVQAIGVALKSNVIRFSSGFNPGYLNP